MKSKYTRFVCRENTVVVYNTLTNGCIELETDNIEEAEDFINSTDDESLKTLGIITDGDEYVLLNQYIHGLREGTNVLHIFLIMTYSCNSNCSYCFEKNTSNDPFFLNPSNIDPIKNYIRSHYNRGYSSLELHFFGGEPLLETGLINELLKYLNENEIYFKSNVITNGTLITEDIAKSFLKLGLKNYQITIDGPKPIHDLRRPLKTKISAFDETLRGIRAIVDLDVQIAIRINIDEDNVEYLPQIISSFYINEDIPKNLTFYVAPVIGVLKSSVLNTFAVRERVLKYAWKMIDENSLPIIISPPVYAPCPYISESSAFYIDLSGRKYICGGLVGEKQQIEGIFFENNEVYKERMKRSNYGIECINCSVFPICMGGCKYEKRSLGNHCPRQFLESMHDEYYTKYFIT